MRYWSEIIDLPEDQISKEDRAIALSNRGIEFVAKGELDRAIRDYDQAIKLNYVDALNNRGFAFANKGKFKRAIRDYDNKLAQLCGRAPQSRHCIRERR